MQRMQLEIKHLMFIWIKMAPLLGYAFRAIRMQLIFKTGMYLMTCFTNFPSVHSDVAGGNTEHHWHKSHDSRVSFQTHRG